MLPACAAEDTSTLGRAERSMADVEAGTLTFTIEAGDVGFGVDGAFARGNGDLPVFDFTYTERLPTGESVATITSNGERVTVDVDGQTRVVDDAGSLRLGEGEGFADLGIASWVDSPREETRGDTTVVTGAVDAADLLADVVRLAAQVNTEGDIDELDDATAERLAALVEVSTIEVVIGADGVPRSVDAQLGFGRDVPEELAEALGPYAASEITVRVTLDPRR